MNVILVHISNRLWTLPAVHLACALARNTHARVILLQLIPVAHPVYLGTGSPSYPPTAQDYVDLEDYSATADDYGVPMSIHPMYYTTALDAIVQAANNLNAEAVFAHVPESRIPFWHRFQTWNLERRLAAAHRQLFVIDRGSEAVDHLPSIVVKPAYNSPSK